MASLVIWIERPLRVYDSHVQVRTCPRGIARTAIHVDDGDPSPIPMDFPLFTIEFQPPPGISVGETGGYSRSGMGSHVEIEVQVEPTVAGGTYPVPFTVRHADNRTAGATLYVHVRGNMPPRAQGELSGTVAATLGPGGAGASAIRLGPVGLSDPEGDRIHLLGLGIPPEQGMVSLSLSGSQLSVLYQPRLAEGDLCGAVRERDVIGDTFTVIIRDACGAETEIPGTVTITVADRAPPTITVPAQDLVVECDGQGNLGEYFAWLANHGGAQAEDPCTPRLSWRSMPGRFVPSCGRTGYRGVVFIVRDAAGNQATTHARFIIRDTTPPTLTVPGDVAVECHESSHPDHTGWARAEDLCDPSPVLAFADTVQAGPCPQARTIIRTWTATDACGNRTVGVQRIAVRDTTAPAITCPADVDLGCNPTDTSPNATGRATAQDNCDPNPTLTHADSVSAQGCVVTIHRTWRASDACGNAAQCVQEIRYTTDTTAPVLTVPPDVYLGCNPPDTSPDATGRATATDGCDPEPEVSYEDSVSTQGCVVTIRRTWRATDACGNQAERAQTITYTADTVQPTITCPGSFTVYVRERPGTWVWVSFPSATAIDNCAPSPSVSCTPSGGLFLVGAISHASTTCTATDACGNSTTVECTFWVTVESVNTPPVARDDRASCNGFCIIPVLANDYDPDGDPLEIVHVSEPMCGTAYVSGGGIAYTTAGWRCAHPPGPGVTDSFSYTITDGRGGYATATVDVTITCEICPLSLPPEE